MLLASAFDQSRYMRADDLKQTTTLRIKSATAEMVNDRGGQVQKLVVWFTNHEKGLVLNKTNNRAIRGKFGDDTAGWVNKLITLFTVHTEVSGKPVLPAHWLPAAEAAGVRQRPDKDHAGAVRRDVTVTANHGSGTKSGSGPRRL